MLSADAVGTHVGQRVAHHGGLAECARTSAAVVTPVPPTLDAVSAAALPCAGMTAHQAVMRRLRLGKGTSSWPARREASAVSPCSWPRCAGPGCS